MLFRRAQPAEKCLEIRARPLRLRFCINAKFRIVPIVHGRAADDAKIFDAVFFQDVRRELSADAEGGPLLQFFQ